MSKELENMAGNPEDIVDLVDVVEGGDEDVVASNNGGDGRASFLTPVDSDDTVYADFKIIKEVVDQIDMARKNAEAPDVKRGRRARVLEFFRKKNLIVAALALSVSLAVGEVVRRNVQNDDSADVEASLTEIGDLGREDYDATRLFSEGDDTSDVVEILTEIREEELMQGGDIPFDEIRCTRLRYVTKEGIKKVRDICARAEGVELSEPYDVAGLTFFTAVKSLNNPGQILGYVDFICHTLGKGLDLGAGLREVPMKCIGVDF